MRLSSLLLAIRDQRLYRQQHKTFEDYCRSRWTMSRQRAHQFIESASVVENLSTIVDIIPANESQARPLVSLEPDQQREAWQEAVATAMASPSTGGCSSSGTRYLRKFRR